MGLKNRVLGGSQRVATCRRREIINVFLINERVPCWLNGRV
jgi:hypothetical protein